VKPPPSENACLKCGRPFLDHPPPTWHYEDRRVNGQIVRTPVLDGHLAVMEFALEEEDE
jgi:hypothetical protein